MLCVAFPPNCGIVGLAQTDSAATVDVIIRNCYATATVLANIKAGGIAAYTIYRARISSCYVTCIVQTNSVSGNSMSGVVASINSGASVLNFYAINARISGPVNANYGRIVGIQNAIVQNNYAWDGILISGFTPTPEDPNTKNGETVTSADVTTPSTHYIAFGHWDFMNLWMYSSDPSINLPILQGIQQALQNPQLPS